MFMSFCRVLRVRLPYRRSRVKWICATTAPWALATGLLISFTASASNDLHSGVSFTPRSATARLVETALIPPTGASIAGGKLGIDRDILRSMPRYDLPDETADSEPLKADRKADAGPDPVVDRALKGSPLVAPHATLSRRARQLRPTLEQVTGAQLLYSHDERLLPPTVLMEGQLEAPESEQVFEPWETPEYTTTRQTTSVQSPAAAAAGSTGAAASPTTPMVKRAIALSSATPAPMEATPIEIAAAPVSLQSPRLDRGGYGAVTILPKGDDTERPRYADLIDPDNMSKEQRCLAEAVYFEARSEPLEGQAAVAQVVLNRVKSGLYPSSICGVVYQNRHRHLACQFTFACEGKALRIRDTESWERAKSVASAVLEGKTYLADVGGATHYHADYVKPYWARRLKKMDVIGRHIFYKLKPGQT
ncbi:cell wall hydrolyses involved in spore germination [Microvirga lotononidis]|uniref:Cell wall hydrolyses involved in spore germination n=1 Tax=Microvirga lotononidis TaxID=864069 RepID=I4YQ48_9HYPH|nr:cell wall hydrolyses involved in spore germination [Microvirga lotononidis]